MDRETLRSKLAAYPRHQNVYTGGLLIAVALVGFWLASVGTEPVGPFPLIAGLFAVLVGVWIAWADLTTR